MRVRRVFLALLLAGGLVGLAACSASDPVITFASAGTTVTAQPIQYCDVQEQHCQADGSAPVGLTVPAGKPVQVSAPKEVADTPWQVAARFADSTGGQYVSCSPLFAAGQQSAYTVHAQHAGDRLVLIEVYQASATLVRQPDGDVSTPIRGTWVLTADTRGGPTGHVLPKPGDNLCTQ